MINCQPLTRSRGMSLIEILVAALVLSVGVLGVAALQGFSLQSNQNAYYRTQATNIAYEVADYIRSDYGIAQSSTDKHEAHGQQLADELLPGTGDKVGVTLSSTSQQFTVSVSWTESRTGDAPGDSETVTITSRY